jgi:predicted N-formylglutamate amidohydrolase
MIEEWMMTLADPALPAIATESYSTLWGGATAGAVVLCDHASNRVPERYGALGLPACAFDRHIAYDIGAEAVAREIAARLAAPAVLSRFSRLLIDPNRGTDDPTLIMRLSDGAVVPGNRHLDDAERDRRIAQYYEPYHTAIGGVIDACLAAGRPPVLLSIHSFTPVWRGALRPWHGAVLWDRDPRLASRLLGGLRADAGLLIGDNEPYTGMLKGDTLWRHGTRRGLAHAIIEVRQDLISDGAGQAAWGARIAGVMAGLLADPACAIDFARIGDYGSHTDI